MKFHRAITPTTQILLFNLSTIAPWFIESVNRNCYIKFYLREYILMVVAVALLMRSRPRKNRIVFWTPQRFILHLTRAILSLGMPIGFVLFSEYVVFVEAGLLMGTLGTDQLGAFSVTLQWVAVFYMLPIGFSHAATTRVSLGIG